MTVAASSPSIVQVVATIIQTVGVIVALAALLYTVRRDRAARLAEIRTGFLRDAYLKPVATALCGRRYLAALGTDPSTRRRRLGSDAHLAPEPTRSHSGPGPVDQLLGLRRRTPPKACPNARIRRAVGRHVAARAR